MLKLFDQAVTEQFLKPDLRALVLQASEPEELLSLFANYKPNIVDKWIGQEVKP